MAAGNGIKNLADEGGLHLTPFWVGFHNGRFDLGTAGRSADRFVGLEEIAETGDTGAIDESQTVDMDALMKSKWKYYTSSMKRRELDPELSDREYLQWWQKELGVE